MPHAEPSNSRKKARHRCEAALVGRLMNEQIDALNRMSSPPVSAAGELPGARNTEVMALLIRRARSMRAIEVGDDAPSSAVALSTLLRGRRPYGGTPGDGTIATFNDGIASLPCDVHDAPLAVTLLAEEARSFPEVPERMKRSEVKLEVLLRGTLPIQLYACQVLQRSRRNC